MISHNYIESPKQTKPQKTLFGYNVRQIRKQIRAVETIGGGKKQVFCLRHPSCLTNVDCAVAEETDNFLVIVSGLKMWRLIK